MLSVKHVHAFSWTCEHLQMSMCMLAVEHMHVFSWVCACLHLSMCTLAIEHVHVFSWAFAYLQLSMCTLAVEHVYIVSVEHIYMFLTSREPWNLLAALSTHRIRDVALEREREWSVLGREMWQYIILRKNMPRLVKNIPAPAIEVNARSRKQATNTLKAINFFVWNLKCYKLFS